MAITNLIQVKFGCNSAVTTDAIYQYNYGQILKFLDLNLPESYEVHFSNSESAGNSKPQMGDSDGVVIPDEYLETGESVYAFIYLHTGENDGETAYKVTIPVRKRPKPLYVEPTEEEQSVITQAIAALQSAERETQSAANDARISAGTAANAATAAAESAASAAGSASAAGTSATNAAGSASAASASASAAAGSASAAAASETAAKGSENAAKASETNAAGSASGASASASAAAGSASAAAASETAAKGSENAAKASETNAAGSASGASASALAASGSASAAAASETNAAASALNAGNSKSDAEAWAVGTRNGEPVEQSDPTYQNNSKWYAEQAAEVFSWISDVAPKYGVSGVGGTAKALTRLWDAVGKTVTPGTDLAACSSGFDALAPFNRRKCVGSWSVDPNDQYKAIFTVQAYYGDADYAEDGTKGDYVAVEVEPFYYLKDDENGIWGVSPGPQSGWSVHPICKDAAGNIRQKTYIPAYNLAIKDGHAVSLPGLDPFFGDYKQNQDAARTYGDGSFLPGMIETAALIDYEELLATVEFATQDIQDDYIMGATNMPYAAGNKVSLTTANENYVVVSSTVGALFVVGQTIYLGDTYSDTPSAAVMASAYNHITAIQACDTDGTLNENGSYYKITFDGDARSTTADTTTISSRPWITGATDGHASGVNKVLGHTGSPVSNSTGKYPFRYRWRENIWGNQNRTQHDLIDVRVADGNSYHLDWYYLADPTKYTPKNVGASDLTEANGWEKLGVTTPVSSYADGYIKAFGHDSKYPFVRVPVLTSGASATTYYSDYAHLVNSSTVRAVRVGGNLNSGNRANYGLFYRNANNNPGNRNWNYGSALILASHCRTLMRLFCRKEF